MAVTRQMLTPEVLADPGRFNEAVNTLAPYFTVDEEFTKAEMTGLALSMRVTSGDSLRQLRPRSGLWHLRRWTVDRPGRRGSWPARTHRRATDVPTGTSTPDRPARHGITPDSPGFTSSATRCSQHRVLTGKQTSSSASHGSPAALPGPPAVMPLACGHRGAQPVRDLDVAVRAGGGVEDPGWQPGWSAALASSTSALAGNCAMRWPAAPRCRPVPPRSTLRAAYRSAGCWLQAGAPGCRAHPFPIRCAGTALLASVHKDDSTRHGSHLGSSLQVCLPLQPGAICRTGLSVLVIVPHVAGFCQLQRPHRSKVPL